MKLKYYNKDIDALELLQKDLESDWEEALERSFKPGEISCMNCTKPSCCNQRATCWFFEVLPMARHLKANKLVTPEFMAELKKVGDEMEMTSPSHWFRLQRPCILLKDGWCSVYKYRPMVSCVSYWVLSPPEQCEADFEDDIKSVDPKYYYDRLTELSFRIHGDMGLEQTKDQLFLAAFPKVLWIALAAWNKPNWVDFVKSQKWPSKGNLYPWKEGLVQLTTSK